MKDSEDDAVESPPSPSKAVRVEIGSATSDDNGVAGRGTVEEFLRGTTPDTIGTNNSGLPIQLDGSTGDGAIQNGEDKVEVDERREFIKCAVTILLTFTVWVSLYVGLWTGYASFDEPDCSIYSMLDIANKRTCEPCGVGTILLPLFGEWEKSWSREVAIVIYLIGILWSFTGMGIVCDQFMAAVEEITGSERVIWREVRRGCTCAFHVKVWNPTMANLTLMALGSSAPEIMLSATELMGNNYFAGRLGPLTIVGSAAFNLFIISAVCVCAIPAPETKRIEGTDTFLVTASFSLLAYMWLLIITLVITPDKIDIWEGVATLLLFPLLLVFAFIADKGYCRQWFAAPIQKVASMENMRRTAAALLGDASEELSPEVFELVHRRSQMSFKPSVLSKAGSRKQAMRVVTGGVGGVSWRANRRQHDENVFFGFAEEKVTVLECAGTLRLKVVATQPMNRAVRMSYYTQEGSAKKGVRFENAEGYLSFPAGCIEKYIEIRIIDNDVWDPDEEFSVVLVGLEQAHRARASRFVSTPIQDNRTGFPRSISDSASPQTSLVVDKLKAATSPQISVQVDKSNAASETDKSLATHDVGSSRTSSHRPLSQPRSMQRSNTNHTMDSGEASSTSPSSPTPTPISPAKVGQTFSAKLKRSMTGGSNVSFVSSAMTTGSARTYGTGDTSNVGIAFSTEKVSVTVLNDDNPGCIGFEFEQTLVERKGGFSSGFERTDSTKKITLGVVRTVGYAGDIEIHYEARDDTATCGKDYLLVAGILQFAHGERHQTIEIGIPSGCTPDQRTTKFSVSLIKASPGVNLIDAKGRAVESTSCEVLLASAEKPTWSTKLLRICGEQEAWSKGMEDWAEQARELLYCGGSPEGQLEAGCVDWMFHIITLFWKVIFVAVPPPSLCQGWPSFFAALCLIGVVTAISGDLASLLGCSLGIPDEITAITMVALGTSLPDTFASKTAAAHDDTADNAVGNITGSNCVNVFLGVGISWTIGAAYWHQEGMTTEWMVKVENEGFQESFVGRYPDGGFFVPTGSIAFSVGVYTICAFVCLGILAVRRRVYGGELGGPRRVQFRDAFFLSSLWGIFVLATCIQCFRSDK